MKCANCLKTFNDDYVVYGGVTFCSEQCLAEMTVKQDLNVDNVEREMEWREI